MVPKKRYKSIIILKRKKIGDTRRRAEYFSLKRVSSDSVENECFLDSVKNNETRKDQTETKYTKKDLENAVAELAERYENRGSERLSGKLDKVGLREIASKYNVPKSTLQDRFGKYKGKQILQKGEYFLMSLNK